IRFRGRSWKEIQPKTTIERAIIATPTGRRVARAVRPRSSAKVSWRAFKVSLPSEELLRSPSRGRRGAYRGEGRIAQGRRIAREPVEPDGRPRLPRSPRRRLGPSKRRRLALDRHASAILEPVVAHDDEPPVEGIATLAATIDELLDLDPFAIRVARNDREAARDVPLLDEEDERLLVLPGDGAFRREDRIRHG